MLCQGTGGRLTSSVADDEGLLSLGLRLTHTDEAWSSSVAEVKQGDLGFLWGESLDWKRRSN